MSQNTPEAVGTTWQELYAAALLELDRNKSRLSTGLLVFKRCQS